MLSDPYLAGSVLIAGCGVGGVGVVLDAEELADLADARLQLLVVAEHVVDLEALGLHSLHNVLVAVRAVHVLCVARSPSPGKYIAYSTRFATRYNVRHLKWDFQHPNFTTAH